MNIDNSFFKSKKINFFCSQYTVDKADIYSSIPFEFEGKDFFIDFYHLHNGGVFLDGAGFNRKKFYQSGFNILSVELFYSVEKIDKPITGEISITKILNIIKEYNPELNMFIKSHFPFARDAGGNEFFIEYPSGIIKYIRTDSRYNFPVEVAPSFFDFCNNIEPLDCLLSI